MNTTVAGTPAPGPPWAVSGFCYLDGTYSSRIEVGMRVRPSRETGQILYVERAFNLKPRHDRRDLTITEECIFEIVSGYPLRRNEDTGALVEDNSLGFPCVILADGTAVDVPKPEEPDYDDVEGPEEEPGKAPQPEDPDANKPSEHDPDSEDQSKPEDDEMPF